MYMYTQIRHITCMQCSAQNPRPQNPLYSLTQKCPCVVSRSNNIAVGGTLGFYSAISCIDKPDKDAASPCLGDYYDGDAVRRILRLLGCR